MSKISKKINRKVFFFIFLFLVMSICTTTAYTPTHYRPIHINNTGGTEQTYYQVPLNITYDSDMNNDFSDIRVKNETSGEYVPYWIEDKVNGSWCKIWFNATYIPANSWCNDTYYLLYGNASASSASDGDATFEFFDDFEEEGGEWTPYSGNPVLSPEGSEDGAAFASVWKEGDTYHMYYSYWNGDGKIRIGHATSSDGKDWTKDTENNPVLEPGTDTWENEHVLCPWVWKEGDTWYMIYHGRGSAKEAIGLATSSDGVNWTKDSNNPVLEGSGSGWEGNSVENFGVMKVGSTYYLWYESAASGERQTGLATSTDLINWTKDPNNPIFTGGRFCSCQFKYGGYYYYLTPHYTSGNNYVELELYRDINPTFYPDEREFVKVVKTCSVSGWDSHDQDTPCVLTNDIYRDSFPDNELWTYYAGESGGIWKTGLLIETDIDAALAKTLEKWTKETGNWITENYDGRNCLKGSSCDQYYGIRTKSFQATEGVIEIDVQCYSGDDTNRGEVDVFWWYQGSNDFSFAVIGSPNTQKSRLYDRSGGSYILRNEKNDYKPLQEWYKIKCVFTNNTVKVYVNDSLWLESDSMKGSRTNNYLGVSSYRSTDYFDNLRVRKYADPEPSALLGAEQNIGGGCTSPTISSLTNSTPTTNSVTITWTTNQSADNRVKYSKNSDLSNPLWSSWDNDTTSVSITLTGLEANTTYYYQAWSYNGTNSSCYTVEPSSQPYKNFTTQQEIPGGCTSPEISSLTVSDITENSAVISWNTNQSSDNRVKYSKYSDLSNYFWSSWDNDTTSVSITLSGLESNTTYYYQVWSYNGTNSSCYTTEPSSEPYKNFTTMSMSESESSESSHDIISIKEWLSESQITYELIFILIIVVLSVLIIRAFLFGGITEEEIIMAVKFIILTVIVLIIGVAIIQNLEGLI